MLSRREILGILGTLPAAGLLGPGTTYAQAAAKFPRRVLGRTGVPVVPYALGGIGSIAHPIDGLDPADIIVRAVQLGINYLDTANVYGPSQRNYGEAFRRLHLTPSDPHYNAAMREGLYIASKTGVRYSFNPPPMPQRSGPPPGMQMPPGAAQGQAGGQGQGARGGAPAGQPQGARGGQGGPPQGGPPPGMQRPMSTAIEDLKRTMTQIWGDGEGFVPEGAYIDCMQIHDLRQMTAVDQIYEGLADRGSSRKPERFGALAGLLDYRDGTNYTGTNPERRKWIRHIGITSHANSAYLMRALRLDTQDIFDTVLMALNANDRQNDSMQYNILPLCVAKGMGVIAMKIFADGVMYGGPRRYLSRGEDVIATVGKPGGIPYGDLLRYPISIPGVTCEVVGIGRINRQKPEADQLVCNLAAAMMDLPDAAGRARIEKLVAEKVGSDTNFYQEKRPEIIHPTEVRTKKDGDRVIVEWNTALAGREALRSYEVRAGQKLLASVPYRPQLTEAPLWTAVEASQVGGESNIAVLGSTQPPTSKA
jgi:aryl-alcohol dehydrogenase-like predicted oxidoreductase